MMATPHTIYLPEELNTLLSKVADASGETTDSVLVDWVVHPMAEFTTDNMVDFSENLTSFTTIRLWTVVEKSMELLQGVDHQMKDLIDKRKEEELSHSEQNKLNELSDNYQDLTLLRTEALVELQERGHDVQSYLEKNAPKP